MSALAHQLADVLTLAPAPFVRTRALVLVRCASRSASGMGEGGRARLWQFNSVTASPRSCCSCAWRLSCAVLLGRAGFVVGRRVIRTMRVVRGIFMGELLVIIVLDPVRIAPASMTRLTGFRPHARAVPPDLVDDVLEDGARRSARATPAPRCPRAPGLSVSVRKGELENVERNRDKSIGVTVYLRPAPRQRQQFRLHPPRRWSRRCAPPTTSRVSPPKTRPPACPTRLTWPTPRQADARARSLFHAWPIDAEAAASSWRCAARRRPLPPTARITNSEGAGVSRPAVALLHGQLAAAFAAATPARATAISVSPIASQPSARRGEPDMQRDYWYSSMRDAARAVGAGGGGPLCRRTRVVASGGRARYATREVPVLFESTLASGLVGAFVGRRSRAARSTARRVFSTAAWDRQVLAPHLDLARRPAARKRARAARPSTTRASTTRAAAGGGRGAWCRATSCRATRRASSA